MVGVDSLVERVEALVEGGLGEYIVRAVLDELGVEFVDDVPNEHADYFIARCAALEEEDEE